MGDLALVSFGYPTSGILEDSAQREENLPAKCALTNSIVVSAIFRLIPTAPLFPTRPPMSPAVTADLDEPPRPLQHRSPAKLEKDAPRTRCFASRCTNTARYIPIMRSFTSISYGPLVPILRRRLMSPEEDERPSSGYEFLSLVRAPGPTTAKP